MKKKLISIGKIAAVVGGILILTFFIFRQSILEYAFGVVQSKFKSVYHCELKGTPTVSGITGFEIENLQLLPEGKDPLFIATSVKGNIRVFSLLTGNIRLKTLLVSNGVLRANGMEGKNNFSFFFKNRKKDDTEKSEKNYAAFLNRLISAAFSSVPDYIGISQLSIWYNDDGGDLKMVIPSFTYNHKVIDGQVLLPGSKKSEKWIVKGSVDRGDETMDGIVYCDSGRVVLPYINKKFKVTTGFDTLSFSLEEKDFSGDRLMLSGKFSIRNFSIKHPKLDSNELRIDRLASDYIFDIGKASVIAEAPICFINKMALKIKAGIDRSQKEEKYALDVSMAKIPAQDFFNSIPEGLFNSFDGIKCEGALSYNLHFALDEAMPDSVVFDSELKSHDFKIKKYGVTNFSKMNGSFLYTAYERGRAVKSFSVGPENPMFTPINEISSYLKTAVLQSEDGSFYGHRGFREDAFRMAIAENVRQGRFARGGSTISMQLVKNVFLSRKKTVARKLEEALIVWIIEQKRLTSKERMYEVYLNVIEWGPMIYGIREASEFYFHKKPSELTIEESIYLASIIPRPKAFKYSFDDAGNLRDYLQSYFKKMAELMYRREVITEEQRNAVVANVHLTGPAREYVVKDTISSDEDDEDSEPQFFLFRKKENVDVKEVKEEKVEPTENKEKKLRLFKRKEEN